MNTTLSPVSFNGRLGDVIKAKNDTLNLKAKHVQSLQNSGIASDNAMGEKQKEIDSLVLSSKQAEIDGKEGYKNAIGDALETSLEAKVKAKGDYKKAKADVSNNVAKAIKKSADLSQLMMVLANEARADKKKAHNNLKEIGKTAKPLEKALKALEGGNIQEAEETQDAVAKAQEISKATTKTVQKALDEIKALETKEKELEAGYKNEAKLLTKGAWKSYINECKGALKSHSAQLAQIKTAKANAIENATKAFGDSVVAAEKVLEEYKDMASHDADKAKEFAKNLSEMKTAVRNLKIQARVTRAKNLENVAEVMVGLGQMGEGATKTVVGRVLGVLKSSIAGVAGKLGAMGAANVIIDKGSENQKTAMATGIELNANKIVDSTSSPEVLEELVALDKKIDALA